MRHNHYSEIYQADVEDIIMKRQTSQDNYIFLEKVDWDESEDLNET